MIESLLTVIKQRRSVMTMMVVMLLAGIVAYITVPKEANPDIDVPVFYISVLQQGISPEDAERLLVRPLETKLRGLDGLKEITGIANEGHAGIVLEFSIDFDKDEALADVRDKVDQAKAELPADAEEPQIFEMNFSLVPTIIVVLSGDVPERTLYANARRLKDQIEAIPSVLEAKLAGHREEQLEVVIDSAWRVSITAWASHPARAGGTTGTSADTSSWSTWSTNPRWRSVVYALRAATSTEVRSPSVRRTSARRSDAPMLFSVCR